MTTNRDVNKPLEEMSLGRIPHDVGNDTRDEKYLKRDAGMKQKAEYIGEAISQATESGTRGVEDTTDQASAPENTNQFVGAPKFEESIREEKKNNATTPQITEEEEEGSYEELICLVRQFYVERPTNPAAIGHHNIETC